MPRGKPIFQSREASNAFFLSFFFSPWGIPMSPQLHFHTALFLAVITVNDVSCDDASAGSHRLIVVVSSRRRFCKRPRILLVPFHQEPYISLDAHALSPSGLSFFPSALLLNVWSWQSYGLSDLASSHNFMGRKRLNHLRWRWELE
jgi:hypothetical protein